MRVFSWRAEPREGWFQIQDAPSDLDDAIADAPQFVDGTNDEPALELGVELPQMEPVAEPESGGPAISPLSTTSESVGVPTRRIRGDDGYVRAEGSPTARTRASAAAGVRERVDRGRAHRKRGEPARRARPSGRGGRLAPSAERVVRARCERVLPTRMGRLARVREAVTAMSPSYDVREAELFGIGDPAMFTRQARPLAQRVREAWWSTDYERLLEASILLPFPEGCQTIPVISPKGGVGKTTVAALFGSLLAFVRHQWVVAVDTNSDMGNLGLKLVPEHRAYIDDLLQGPLASEGTTPMDLMAYLGRSCDGLMVAPAPAERERAEALDEDAYRRLFERMAQLSELLVLDCGTGLSSPATRAALGTADQVVVVSNSEPDTMSMISHPACRSMLEGLDVPVFLVVNMLTAGARARIDLGAFERELSFAAGIVEVPYDRRAAESLYRSRFTWSRQPPEGWAIALRELAALIAASWPAREQP